MEIPSRILITLEHIREMIEASDWLNLDLDTQKRVVANIYPTYEEDGASLEMISAYVQESYSSEVEKQIENVRSVIPEVTAIVEIAFTDKSALEYTYQKRKHVSALVGPDVCVVARVVDYDYDKLTVDEVRIFTTDAARIHAENELRSGQPLVGKNVFMKTDINGDPESEDEDHNDEEEG